MRPNLMSPRRVSTSGEDSILAMLEREPARKRKEGTSGAKLAWYGGSATVALALIGTLVWMAATNDGRRLELQEPMLVDAGSQAQHPATSTVVVASAPSPAPTAGATIVQVAMAPEAQARSPAVIVDQPPAETVPPLRLLKPAPHQPAPEQAAPARPVARNATPPRPAAAQAGVSAEPKPVARLAAAATAPARPKPLTLAKTAARPPQPRAQRAAQAAKSADGGVDADVALISAVIVHANGHAPEGSQMTELLCPNDNCQSRPARK